MKRLDLERARAVVKGAVQPHYRGRIDQVSGVLVEATGLSAAVGEMCRVERHGGTHIDAEVVGFRGPRTLLMPHGDVSGLAPSNQVVALGRSFSIRVGDELLGRAIDGFGRPIDGGAPLRSRIERDVRQDSPEALSRPAIEEPLATGVRAIDGLNTIGRGQRIGIFAGSGVGKSTLLSQITRGTDADAIVVALVGERGREVGAFVEEVLKERGRERATLVVATSDRPPIERFSAPFVALSIAEHLRDEGRDVLLVLDSITRFAHASREIGLAAGEPPTVRGFPPSFFATVPKIVERMGRSQKGSITGLLTVLLDGDDPNEPVADTLRGLLDGHLLLSRKLAHEGHYPAIDVLQSLSRLMPSLASKSHLEAAGLVRGWLAAHREGRDLIEIGAYKPGTNQRLDAAIARLPVIEAYLRQGVRESTSIEESLELLQLVAHGQGGSR